MKEEDISEVQLATAVSKGIAFKMTKDVLIKPLEVIKVQKLFEEPIVDKKSKADGMEVKDYEKTRLVTKEVESNFRKGIVLSLPSCLDTVGLASLDYEVGSTVVFPKKFAIEFDLFKDSLLVKPYDIVAVVKDSDKSLTSVEKLVSSVKE